MKNNSRQTACAALGMALFLSEPRVVRAEKEGADEGHDEASKRTAESVRHEIASYAQLAKKAGDEGKWPLAEHYIGLCVNLPAPDAEKKSALREIGETYERGKGISKAIAIYEKMIELYPNEADTPELIFKVGILYRQCGVYQRAIARFYSVLNSALKVNERDFQSGRALTLRAQIEIADTYFLAGDYAQAAKFCNLLNRLDLQPDVKAGVKFKAAHCQYLLGDFASAVDLTEKFLAEFPQHASAPECRYILASALRGEGRTKEAFDAVLALLREEKARQYGPAGQWVYWQKKTGNDFANTYYQQGDFRNALAIYQTLAQLSDDPEWQWPVIYQMGLCFERLQLAGRAAEAYKFIIDESQKPQRSAKAKPPESAADLVQMARWRGEQIAWRHTTEATLEHLLGDPLLDASAKKPEAVPASAAALH